MEFIEETADNTVLKRLDLEVTDMLDGLKLDAPLDALEEEEEFEPVVHNPIVEVKPATPMTTTETQICELYSSGHSTKSIAETLGIGAYTVRNVLSKPHIKDFVNELINAQYASTLEGRLRILNKVVDAKLEKIEEEYDGDFSKATKKDIVDLLVIGDNMLKERQKKELGTNDNVYLNIVQQITGG